MRRYSHSFEVDSHYHTLHPKYSIPEDNPSYFQCWFWDTGVTLPTETAHRDYHPTAIMNLRNLPGIGNYVNFNNALYVIEGMCIVGRETTLFQRDVKYDFEIKKIEEQELL